MPPFQKDLAMVLLAQEQDSDVLLLRGLAHNVVEFLFSSPDKNIFFGLDLDHPRIEYVGYIEYCNF